MCRKIRNTVAALAVAGATVFQMNGCNVAQDAFKTGVDIGYMSETGTPYFGSAADDGSMDAFISELASLFE